MPCLYTVSEHALRSPGELEVSAALLLWHLPFPCILVLPGRVLQGKRNFKILDMTHVHPCPSGHLPLLQPHLFPSHPYAWTLLAPCACFLHHTDHAVIIARLSVFPCRHKLLEARAVVPQSVTVPGSKLLLNKSQSLLSS